MKRSAILALAAVFVFAASSQAQTIVGSRHDLRLTGGGTPTGNGLTEVCVVCHTPHQAAGATSQDPLWNHTGTATAAFSTYGSLTLDATPVEIGGAAMGSQSVSMLCMSCHDGTVSVLSMYNPPNSGTPTVTAVATRIDAGGLIISTANMGTSLTDDHPVNFTYDTALSGTDGGLYDPATTPAAAALLIGGEVQCSSCHDVHDPTNVPFLTVSNAASALCLTCHIK
jgi:predicted CXXCH cytochrome family protein